MKNSGISISLSSILTIIFVVAKLMGVIDWSWWLVFAPTIINVGLALIAFMILLIIAVIVDLYSK
jgi:hypothetical protein